MQEVVSSDEAALGPLVARELAAARAMATATELARGEPTGAAAAALRRKEGIYGAACTLDYQLDDHVDFVPWLTESLLPELAVVRLLGSALQRILLRIAEAMLSLALVHSCAPAAMHTALERQARACRARRTRGRYSGAACCASSAGCRAARPPRAPPSTPRSSPRWPRPPRTRAWR